MTTTDRQKREKLAELARKRGGPLRVNTHKDLVTTARLLGVRHDWHEPDEQGLTARLEGNSFDNAGIWPEPTSAGTVEQYVVLSYADPDDPAAKPTDVAAINLADLLGWATRK